MNCPRSYVGGKPNWWRSVRRRKALEEEARQRADIEARKRGKARDEDEAQIAQWVAKAVDVAVPKPKSQRNFTDPQSRIMETPDGSFHQCFSAQAVVDADHQVIVATNQGHGASDVASLIPMTEQVQANTGRVPQ